MAERLRLADLLGGLSIVADLGFGLPPEEAMRTCLIGTSFAREQGMSEEEVSATFYTSMLLHIGCTALSHETAEAWGDEHTLMRAAAQANVADPEDIARTVLPAVTEGLSGAEAARIERYATFRGAEFGRRFDVGSCEVASATARRIGLGPGVERALYEVVEWWNGEGPPRGLAGDEIALPARIARIAADAARFNAIGDADGVRAALKARAGTILDPGLVDAFAGVADRVLADSEVADPRVQLLAEEPEPHLTIESDELPRVAAAFGDLGDLKTPWMHGHSGGVAALAGAVAEALRFDRAAARETELAALLQDLGRVAVPNSIWEKAGSLTPVEWEQVRLHPYFSERILTNSEGLRHIARLAGSHHERLDGSGYHRGSGRPELSPSARVLAAADTYRACVEDRPHRPARTPEEAAAELRREGRAGRLDPEIVDAVLEAAGHAKPGRRGRTTPGGLSAREVEVAGLVAAGLTNPQIAERLVISRRTAEHHVQHIYAKVGVSSRAGLALFAQAHGLIDGPPTPALLAKDR